MVKGYVIGAALAAMATIPAWGQQLGPPVPISRADLARLDGFLHNGGTDVERGLLAEALERAFAEATKPASAASPPAVVPPSTPPMPKPQVTPMAYPQSRLAAPPAAK